MTHAGQRPTPGPCPFLFRFPACPPDLQARLSGRDLIVFDGVCVQCSGFFRFMLRRDRQGHFSFATAQSPRAQAHYAALELPLTEFETNLVVVDGQIHQRIAAFSAAMQHLGGIWAPLGLLRFLPGVLKDPAYHLIARNSYRLFGPSGACLMPGPEVRGRFLPGGFGG